MNWLILLVLLTQASFYWLLKPVIAFTTPLFDLRALWVVALAVSIWIFAGNTKDDAIR